MDKMDKYGMDLEKVNIERLKEIFPECVTDGKVNFDALRTILGDDVETSGEKYSFNWVGKSDAMKIALMPSTGTLRPCKDKNISKDWDETENLYIEGDNLEVLKILEKTYHNQIKMIYIDPPYNTGKDFVYHDDFHDNVSNYLENSDQAFRTNPETAGRFHTDWLNMMYPRLKIARELLKEEGVIFISIDDNEVDNLRKLCDEIFGECNFVAQCIRRTINSGKHDVTTVAPFHEYVLIYAKSIDNVVFSKKPKCEEERDKLYKETDEYVRERGRFYITQLNKNSLQYSDSLNYPIIGPDGKEIWPGAGFDDKIWIWRWSKQKVEWGIQNGFIVFKKVGDKYKVYTKSYEYMDKDGNQIDRNNPYSTLEFIAKEYANFNATPELERIFDGVKVFDFPKSMVFLKELIKLSGVKDGIILDFFSGSATTAHAVMDLNFEDGGKRKFIMVQLPEACDESSEAFKAGYSNICEIGEERIRRAGDEIIKLNKASENTHQVSLFDETKIVDRSLKDLDVGFKVFKLDSTNIKPWDATVKYDQTSIYELQESVVKEDRSNLDIAYEVMLKYGIFNMPLEEIPVNGKTAYSVGEGYMIISLNDEITTEDVAAIAALNPKAVVFKDSAFANDNAKMNADYTFKRLGIDNVKCI